MPNLTTRVTALESDVAEMKTDIKAMLAMMQANQPAAPIAAPVAAPVEDKPFVEWIRETAPARKARQSSNKEMAAWMRSKGLTPNGAAWEACKKGERNVRTLKALAAK